jgi:hypothetical protein
MRPGKRRALPDTPEGRVDDLIESVVPNWLRNTSRDSQTAIPCGSMMAPRFRQFQDELPLLCDNLTIQRNELAFNDYTTLTAEWLKERSWWEERL